MMDNILNTVSSITSSMVSTVASSVSSSGDNERRVGGVFNNLANHKILKIGSELNGLFGGSRYGIELPQLVVVGTQSSGKSTVLNSLIGMNILPTGKTMVTRTPLDLRLINSKGVQKWKEIVGDGADENTGLVVFGNYDQGRWKQESQFIIENCYKPTAEEFSFIRGEIERQTIKIAGKNKNVNPKPIFCRIYAPHVPNLSLVDLPGLTMVACTDKGQPKDIKDQIRRMVASYIKKPKTLILAVMPARQDLEADMALDLVKEYDAIGQRTIGILTKVDLMNKGSHVRDYLLGNISKDLKLKHGYYAVYAVCNKDGLDREKEASFFRSRVEYRGKECQKRIGCPNLSTNLSHILVTNLKNELPNITKQILEMELEVNKELAEMGSEIPQSEQGKISMIHNLVAKFCNDFVSILNDRGGRSTPSVNTGRKIKDIFIRFRETTQKTMPFTPREYTDKYILDMIKNCEGNHMSFPIPPVEVLESCLKDPVKQPVKVILPIAKQCLKEVNGELVKLVTLILEKGCLLYTSPSPRD